MKLVLQMADISECPTPVVFQIGNILTKFLKFAFLKQVWIRELTLQRGLYIYVIKTHDYEVMVIYKYVFITV
jgi:hypothetical protein